MKNPERATQVWSVLALAATNRQLLTYEQVGSLTGIAQVGLGEFLHRPGEVQVIDLARHPCLLWQWGTHGTTRPQYSFRTDKMKIVSIWQLPQRMPHAVVTATHPERAWLDKITSNRYTGLVASLVACPCGVQVAKDAG